MEKKSNKPRVIALYLPQYHPFPENDEWWGKGFTEWTNVGRAKPLFKGHDQPKIPTELGYYDLRLPIVREQQAQLAREAGVEGFCYWHYWFGNGKQLLNEIIDEVIATGKPDFPFCFGWANHSWSAKNWNRKDTSLKDRLLIEQTYPGDEDIRKHYEYVLKAFKDKRYLTQDGKPIFLVWNPKDVPANFITLWQKWSKEDGFPGIYFIANVDAMDKTNYIAKGFDAMYYKRAQAVSTSILRHSENFSLWKFIKSRIKLYLFKKPALCFEYKEAMPYLIDEKIDRQEDIIPGLVPNFDHSPRSKQFGFILHNSTPNLFYHHCKQIFDLVSKKNNKIVFLRSWNEWGEGNYMEPDIKYGRGYVEALRKAMDEEK